MIVEAKPEKTLSTIVEDWLRSNDHGTNRKFRLEGLCDILSLGIDDVSSLSYQLLHRTAAALIEADQLPASIAAMLVVSSGPKQKWFEAYSKFGSAMGVPVGSRQFVDVGMRHGSRLLLGWLDDTA